MCVCVFFFVHSFICYLFVCLLRMIDVNLCRTSSYLWKKNTLRDHIMLQCTRPFMASASMNWYDYRTRKKKWQLNCISVRFCTHVYIVYDLICCWSVSSASKHRMSQRHLRFDNPFEWIHWLHLSTIIHFYWDLDLLTIINLLFFFLHNSISVQYFHSFHMSLSESVTNVKVALKMFKHTFAMKRK